MVVAEAPSEMFQGEPTALEFGGHAAILRANNGLNFKVVIIINQ